MCQDIYPSNKAARTSTTVPSLGFLDLKMGAGEQGGGEGEGSRDQDII